MKHYSVAFLGFWLSSDLKGCLDTLIDSERYGNAVVFAKSYCPSYLQTVYDNWKISLKKQNNQLLLQRIVNPADHPDQFEELLNLEKIEQVVSRTVMKNDIPSMNYCLFKDALDGIDFYEIAKNEGIDALEAKLNEIIENHREVRIEEIDNVSEIEKVEQEEEEPVEDEKDDDMEGGWEELDIGED